MKCPKCGFLDDKVLESRVVDEGASVRRRRECLSCGYRFTSYEHIKEKIIKVVKKDNRREDFNTQKIFNGISKAVEKRPVSQDDVSKMVASIEERVSSFVMDKGVLEIKSTEIGELVMEALRKVDTISFIRFASVYIYEEETFKHMILEVLQEDKNK